MKQKEKKANLIDIVTPKGIAIYPWLNKPDTKFEPNGLFKVTLRLPKESSTDLVQKIEKALMENYREAEEQNAKSVGNGKKPKEIKIVKPFSPVLGEQEEETGELDFLFKMKHRTTRQDGSIREMQPVIVDAQETVLTHIPEIYSGSIIRVSGYIDPYLKNLEQFKVGATLRLQAVQIIELVQPMNSKKKLGFGKDPNGFVADQAGGSHKTNQVSREIDDLPEGL